VPTRAAASAPNAWDRAIRWGIAVIGMKIAMSAPMVDPMTRATAIHS
jgi:hypothetical protein